LTLQYHQNFIPFIVLFPKTVCFPDPNDSNHAPPIKIKQQSRSNIRLNVGESFDE
jgi:hypothetical protein